MKRTIFLLVLAMAVVCAMAGNGHTLEEIRDQWQSRSIKVAKGGASPNVVQLLTAFNDVWGEYDVGRVLKCASNPRFTSMRDEELNEEIIVDRKNGYVCLDNGGTDSGFMQACVWRRDNGHRLFAIVLGQPVDPEIAFVCFYDYDPKTATMHPEKGPEQEFHPLGSGRYIGYSLPRKGKDFIISEYENNLEGNISHVFTWDGSRHHFSHISIDNPQIGYRWFSTKETQYLVEMTKIAFLTLPGQEGPIYLLSDEEEEGMVAIAPYKSGIELIGINDPITQHKLIFYPNAVVTQAEINDYTSYTFIKDGLVWQVITEYPTLGQNGQPKVTADGWDELSDEAAREKIKSLGQPIQVKPQWRRVRLSNQP